jgi:hypothetical protein
VLSKEAMDMATLLDQVTELKRTPAQIDQGDGPDLDRDDVRSRRRRRGGADGGDEPPLGTATPLRAVRPSWTDSTPRRHGGSSYAAALVDIVPILPTVGAIATVFAYVGGPTLLMFQLHLVPLVVGALIAVVVGLVGACLSRPFLTAAPHAHPRSFAEIRQRVDSLAAQLNVLEGEMTPQTPVSQRLAFEEAVIHARALEADLARSGPQWVIGTGYVDALTRLHRAEETLMAVQPAPDVLAGALFDELRIAGSTMGDREHLLGKLRTAVQALRPSAVAYLSEYPSERTRRAGNAQPVRPPAAANQPDGAAGDALPVPISNATATAAEVEARIVLREVRQALNDFRDESRAQLIRSRCRLLGTMTMTGVITYILLAFAVSLDGSHAIALDNPIAAAAAIYLVGGVVGLFNRLHVESGDDAAGEDYGLSKTRLLLTPMLSGLAAVGGVLITGMLSGIVDINAFTPIREIQAPLASGAIAAGAGGQTPHAALNLGDIFNLQTYPFALVLAAVFGLTPKTFLNRLQRASEQSHLDLKSTAAHQPLNGGRRAKPASDES